MVQILFLVQLLLQAEGAAVDTQILLVMLVGLAAAVEIPLVRVA